MGMFQFMGSSIHIPVPAVGRLSELNMRRLFMHVADRHCMLWSLVIGRHVIVYDFMKALSLFRQLVRGRGKGILSSI